MAYYVQTQAGLKGPIPNPKLAQLLEAGKLTPQSRLYDQQGKAVTTVSRALQPAAQPAGPAGLDLDGIVDSLKAERAQPASPPPPPAAKRTAAAPTPAGIDLDDIVNTIKQEQSTPAAPPAPPRRAVPAAPSAGVDLDDIVNTLKAEEAPAPARRSAAVAAPAGIDLDGIVDELREEKPAPGRTPRSPGARRSPGRGQLPSKSRRSRGAAASHGSSVDAEVQEPVRLPITIGYFRVTQVVNSISALIGLGLAVLVGVAPDGGALGASFFLVTLAAPCLIGVAFGEWVIRSLKRHENWARRFSLFISAIALCSIVLLPLGLFMWRELKRAEPVFLGNSVTPPVDRGSRRPRVRARAR